MRPRVLCVDDEPRVLDGLELHLAEHFDVTVATSGTEGLVRLGDDMPFDVVVSDMRMPGMDGATFLAAVKERAVETVRILLTGQTDAEAARRAVNEGGIYRYLTKPCAPDELVRTLEDAIELRRLRGAERALLDQTVRGCVAMLTDVLSVAAPTAFRRAARTGELARRMMAALPADVHWELEVAALLTSVGSVAVPTDLLERADAGASLSEADEAVLSTIPSLGAKLVSHVPRLERVASWIEHARPTLTPELAGTPLGLLNAAQWLDRALVEGLEWDIACHKVRRVHGDAVASRLGPSPPATPGERPVRAVTATELRAGMIVCDPIRTRTGQHILPADTELSPATVLRLKTFAANVGLEEPIRVR